MMWLMRRVLCLTLAALTWIFPLPSVFPETVELVTYYPAPASENVHVTSLTVGTDYQTASPGNGEALVFDSLGIGPGLAASGPSNRLQVVSTTFQEGIDLTGTGPGMRLFDGSNPRGGLGVATAAGQYGVETVAGDLSLFSKVGNLKLATTPTAGANPSVRLTVTPAGNVGIGITAPQALLDIVGDGGFLLVPRKSTAGDPSVPVGVTGGIVYYNAPAGKFRLYENSQWKDVGTAAGGGGQVETGTYVGQSTAGRIVPVSFTPKRVTLYSSGSACFERTDLMPIGRYFKNNVWTIVGNSIGLQIVTNGFSVGGIDIDNAGFSYYWVAER